MNVRLVAWLCALLPIAAAHLCYLISASADLVPWCFPYIDGCTSISRAGRHGFANHVFKAVMLPTATLFALFWWLAFVWLRALGNAARRRALAMLMLGMAGAAFMVLYTTFLGVEGAIYQWLRRYGIVFYFSFTVVAQMLMTSAVYGDPRVPPRIRQSMAWFCFALLALGLASIPLQHIAADADAAVNALEWTYALLMVVFFPIVSSAWARTGFKLRPVMSA